jgi:F420-non-reducing hydrogenase iron-sulfur subunit
MTIKRITFLQELLKFMGLEGRLHLEWISSAEAQKFVRVVTEFTEKIKALGTSPLSVFKERVTALNNREKPKTKKYETLPLLTEDVGNLVSNTLFEGVKQAGRASGE